MKTILVATDFSPRSDRALRRAILIARGQDAELVLTHVIDDDRQERLVTSERLAAQDLLDEMTASVRREDAVECVARLCYGAPHEAIIGAAIETAADLIVMGPHRRQSLKDIFVGTTVERVIRKSPLPVLMNVAPPTGAYDRAMVAVDLSDNAAAAIDALRRMELARHGSTGVVHVFEAPAQGLMLRASTTSKELKDYIAGQRVRASAELDAFLDRVGIQPDFRLLELADASPAESILAGAAGKKVDLVVIGTRGLSGVSRFLLGSVAEGVLRRSRIDVLVVPLPATAAAA